MEGGGHLLQLPDFTHQVAGQVVVPGKAALVVDKDGNLMALRRLTDCLRQTGTQGYGLFQNHQPWMVVDGSQGCLMVGGLVHRHHHNVRDGASGGQFPVKELSSHCISVVPISSRGD